MGKPENRKEMMGFMQEKKLGPFQYIHPAEFRMRSHPVQIFFGQSGHEVYYRFSVSMYFLQQSA